jgi:hypothetical protein
VPAVGDVYFGTYNYEDGGASPKLIVLLYIDAEHDVAISCLVTKHEIKKDKATNIGCRPEDQGFESLCPRVYNKCIISNKE